MADIDGGHRTNVNANVEDQTHSTSCFPTVPFLQKLLSEVLGTYFVIFAGCAAVVVNADKEKVVSLPGISIVWGLVVMVMVYSVGHISGAHFNPAVTIAFASCRRFSLKQVPAYVGAQVLGSTLASGTLRLIFNGHEDHFAGTLPALLLIIEQPISGASMNPARSLGPAIVSNQYRGIWVYMLGPTAGAISGAWVYNIIRFTDKPLREITKSTSFLRSAASRNASKQ
ncbi:hypothetical protein M8C21_018724 [Ambrosia artemisiifolia]|uniref:Uncharacterized protein n=1 Tax=Ambrosia artemisiifolia TaxID=4212 RepID=A0AAD5DB98_AMBAR|nr:hypothetical protein M8C21_018724 [Ambrosia artemisiifolia]